MKAELTKPKAAHPLDAARAVLHDPVASVAALGGAHDSAGAVRQGAETAIADKEAARAAAALGEGSADDLEAKLMALDADLAAAKRRFDLAAATEAKLAERLAAARDAEAQKAKRLAYDEGAAWREAFAPRQTEFLDRFIRDWRTFLRERCELELRIRAVNKDLPEGANPIPSVELIRRLPLAEPEVETRPFVVFTGPAGEYFAEEGACTAKARPDGLFDCVRPDGSTGPMAYLTCSRVEWVEVTTMTRRPYLASGALATEIAIPAARDGDAVGWTWTTDAISAGEPTSILRRLDHLELLAPGCGLHEDVKVTKMPAADWRKRQADKVA